VLWKENRIVGGILIILHFDEFRGGWDMSLCIFRRIKTFWAHRSWDRLETQLLVGIVGSSSI
jgi:hypothetical protein